MNNQRFSGPAGHHGLRRWSAATSTALVMGCASMAVLLSGCTTTAPQATALRDELPFDVAIERATDGLVAQTQKLPALLAQMESKLMKRAVVLDPMLDASSGQLTTGTQLLEKRVTEQMVKKYPQFEILPFRSVNLAKAQYLLTGTMTRVPVVGSNRSNFQLQLALTELKTGQVVAQSSALARGDGIDATPLPYYNDSPVLVKDKVIDGYIRTSATTPGQKGDPAYLERIATATLISEATELYNAGRYQDALGQYRSALATPAGEQLRVLNGLYLTNWKLGRQVEAEQAFGKVVSLGIAYNELGVKFLFNPGTTDFWSDPKVSGAYGIWLRQIARQTAEAKVCMRIVGHTSRTGSDQVNETLSLRRATYMRQRLGSEVPELTPRMSAIGVGSQQNLIGTGTDDAADALDRRVEFKIVGC